MYHHSNPMKSMFIATLRNFSRHTDQVKTKEDFPKLKMGGGGGTCSRWSDYVAYVDNREGYWGHTVI